MLFGCDLVMGQLGLWALGSGFWAQDRVRKTTAEALAEMLGFLLFL